jgi:hypothetical protein
VNEIERIVDQLRRAFEGNAWSGPSVLEVLAGVATKQAAAKPVPGAHSIWENVLHIGTDHDVVKRRLLGEVIVELRPDQDWPPAPDPTPDAWTQAVEHLKRTHQQLLETVAALAPERLQEVVPGKGYSVYVMLHGVAQHALYHAGQIAMLRKARTRCARGRNCVGRTPSCSDGLDRSGIFDGSDTVAGGPIRLIATRMMLRFCQRGAEAPPIHSSRARTRPIGSNRPRASKRRRLRGTSRGVERPLEQVESLVSTSGRDWGCDRLLASAWRPDFVDAGIITQQKISDFFISIGCNDIVRCLKG